MPIRIQPYEKDLTDSVAEFNRRMVPANIGFDVPEQPYARWLPKVPGREIYQEIFLAVEDRLVRGAYTFKRQEFSFRGDVRWVGACQMPISEGLLDRRYSLVGPKLVSDALRREPLSYGLGMGYETRPLVRMVRTMGWNLRIVPFYFKVLHPFEFCRKLAYGRRTAMQRIAMDALAFSGLAWAGVQATRLGSPRKRNAEISAEQVSAFSEWTSEVWNQCHRLYSMVGRRDCPVLKTLYPEEDARFIRLRIRRGDRTIGWVVMLDTQMSENKYFGNLRVGSIVDCLAAPEDADPVIAAASEVLENRGVDLIVSNQSHAAWGRAETRAGFLRGRSNYLFVTSIPLTELLREIDPDGSEVHLNRGDGDGPIHL